MRKERTARIVTVAVLALAAAIALGRKNGWKIPDLRPAPPGVVTRAATSSPQDAIYAMLDAARAGDVKAFLAAYTGQMAAALEQSLAESTPAAFAKYLRDSNAAIKGVAISEPQTLTDHEVKVRLEYVYQDRNEAQVLYLEKGAAGWKITRVDGAERVKTLVPYGTPVQ